MAHQSICSVEGCEKPVYVQKRGLCKVHYQRWWKFGRLTRKQLPKGTQIAWLEAHKDYKESDCLIWPFARYKNGYGAIELHAGETMTPSRVMCILLYGTPSAGEETRHLCGKGHLGCVAPTHLIWSTRKENQADKIAHGTSLRGERHHQAKLSESDVRKIRSLGAQGTKPKAIAESYGVTTATISLIIKRKNWAWLPDEEEKSK